MHTIDLLNLAYSKLGGAGVQLRLIRGHGLSSGLCRVKGNLILFIDDNLTAKEQFVLASQTFDAIEFELNSLPKPLRIAIETQLTELAIH